MTLLKRFQDCTTSTPDCPPDELRLKESAGTGIKISFCSPQADLSGLLDSFIACDIETTGLVAAKSEILEVGAIRFVGGIPIDTFSSLIRPSAPIPREIIRLTGIREGMVSTAPGPLEVLRDFLLWSKEELLVAHNARFEALFLREHLQRQNLRGNLTFLCTCDLARQFLDLPNYKLATVAAHFNIPIPQAHRAIPDAAACGAVAHLIAREQAKVLSVSTERRRAKRKR